MAKYRGSVTTTGNSDGIRFEKALFQACPEFRQRAKVSAHVIGRGQILVSIIDDITEDTSMEEDPVISAFLSFLSADMEQHPAQITPLSQEKIAQAIELTKDVVVSDDDFIPDDISF
jgi:antitoxin PrlF